MNILSQKEKELIKSGLKRRFIIIASILISSAFVIGTISLVPAYIMLSSDFDSGKKTAQNLNEKKLNREILEAPAEIETKMRLLQSHTQNRSFLSYIKETFDLLPDSMRISGISFNRDKIYKDNENVWAMITGFSKDRASLIQFVNDLRATGKFLLVEIPVSDLTKETNLNFSINLIFQK